jgi:predicted neuraminidase
MVTLSVLLLMFSSAPVGADTAVIVRSEFIFEQAPFASAHASTIVETGNSLLSAWFGGTGEGNLDVGIWMSHFEGESWSFPVEVANGVQPDSTRFPCWNPVLFQPSHGPLLLFYKVGPNPREWWGMVKTSTDFGQTWSETVRLPDGILGPIRAKPVELGLTLLCGSSTEHAGWVVHMERVHGSLMANIGPVWLLEDLASVDSWETTGALNDPNKFGAIQPTILVHSDNTLQILCRSQQGVITQAWSEDGGHTWGPMTATTLPNPNAGIDVTKLADGRFLLVYNPITQGRNKLALAISTDGINWRSVAILEDSSGEYSYPAQIQTRDGLVHITYTWKRERIKHVVVDPSRLK